jgi:hypothetical protein
MSCPWSDAEGSCEALLGAISQAVRKRVGGLEAGVAIQAESGR